MPANFPILELRKMQVCLEAALKALETDNYDMAKVEMETAVLFLPEIQDMIAAGLARKATHGLPPAV